MCGLTGENVHGEVAHGRVACHARSSACAVGGLVHTIVLHAEAGRHPVGAICGNALGQARVPDGRLKLSGGAIASIEGRSAIVAITTEDRAKATVRQPCTMMCNALLLESSSITCTKRPVPQKAPGRGRPLASIGGLRSQIVIVIAGIVDKAKAPTGPKVIWHVAISHA
jgi:hypothetical protein